MPKNMIPMYDCDTPMFMPNFMPSEKFMERIIDGIRVSFDYDIAYTDVIYSSEHPYYCYSYAYVYKGKLVAIGEELGRCGGITHILSKEKDARQIVNNLKDCTSKEDNLLYEKIKDMEIAKEEELPNAPTPVYHISDDECNHYYINDNTDGTFTLWLANNEKCDGEELYTKSDLNDVLAALFNEITLKVKSERIDYNDK